MSNENNQKQDLISKIQQELKKKGYRASQNRDIVLIVLDRADKPLTIAQIHERATESAKERIGTGLDHSTTYRIIESLIKEGYIKVISLLEGHNRYEIERGDHHHHLVCTECQEILPVHLEEHLEETETNLEEETGYKITSHSLEFFGVCGNCKVSSK